MTSPLRHLFLASLLSTSALTYACSPGDSPGNIKDDGDTGDGDTIPDGDGDGDDGGNGDGDIDVGCSGDDCPSPSICGDSMLASAEICDDGNVLSGDGCKEDCSAVESGYICRVPGQACRPYVRCGDGVVTPPEQCDDGDVDDTDGCSARCKLELGYKCLGEPSSCSLTECGDSEIEGTEGCDDGNRLPGDGCGMHCQVEPQCGPSGCSSACGDGLVLGEDCDDGNLTDGDGCSSTCTVEEGAECKSASCETVDDKCVVRVPAIYRDFDASHSDFQVGCESPIVGLVLATLDQDGKPVAAAASNDAACLSNFGDWYHDKPGINKTLVGEILLFENDQNGFVNRWKDDGTQFTSLQGVNMDGQPFFFPIDTQAGTLTPLSDRHAATVSRDYAGTGQDLMGQEIPQWSPESRWETPAPLHNFHFTSEVKYWFRYDASEIATLEFLGDDDVWVFINGILAIDLGGLHPPLADQVTVSEASAAQFQLEDGKVYPISIFHAERKRDGSSFQLTLTGLSMGRSVCESKCGDGVIGPDEECDDGTNAGGYNECQPDCRLGGFCGDGIIQEQEECDFRAADAQSGCTTGCSLVKVR